MRILSPLLSIVLAPLLAAGPLLSQVPAPALVPGLPAGPAINSSPAPPSELRLDLHVVPNDPASAAALIVEVTDQTGAPVPDAAVVFRLPDSSPLATFADGSLSAVSYTNPAGRAHIESLRWLTAAVSASVKITAVKGPAHAALLIEQHPQPASSSTLTAPALTTSASTTLARTAPALTTPGTLASSTRSFKNSDSPGVNVPVRHALTTEADEAESPRVSITSAGPASGSHSKLKWLALIALGAGAGEAVAMLHPGGGSGSSSSSAASGATIGSPTISVGHP